MEMNSRTVGCGAAIATALFALAYLQKTKQGDNMSECLEDSKSILKDVGESVSFFSRILSRVSEEINRK